jgi:rhamnulokinase
MRPTSATIRCSECSSSLTTHDTAVAAIPAAADKPWAFLSSGLVAHRVSVPVIIDEQSLKYNFTNEGGVDGTFRFSRTSWAYGWFKCRRTWERAGRATAR